MHTLSATLREEQPGKSNARKLRASGKIPAVVYAGGGDSTSISIDPTELGEIFRKTQNRNTIVHLDMGGEQVPSLVKTTQRHPVKRDILHVDFYRLEPGQVVNVDVPLAGTGRAAGMALGGRLRLIRRTITVTCAWDKIPAVIEHDITPMEIGDMVKATELTMPDGVELVIKHDFNVMSLYGKRVSGKKS